MQRRLLMDVSRGERIRTGWAVFAVMLSLFALLIEASTHHCAALFFDPLPDELSTAAYLFLALTIASNEVLLRRFRTREDFAPRLKTGSDVRRLDLRWTLW